MLKSTVGSFGVCCLFFGVVMGVLTVRDKRKTREDPAARCAGATLRGGNEGV